MKTILSLIICGVLVVSGFGQTRNVLVGTNNAVVQPTNFWSADAANARSGLGLGSSATNPSSAFQPASSVLSNLVSGGSVTLSNINVGISNVTGLQTALDGKLGTNPTLFIANISNLQTALDGKLGTNPTLQISNIAALQTALDGKLSGSFPIAISNVSGLQTSLDGKLSTNPILSISNISGLQTNLDSKLSITGNAVNLTNFPASLLRTTGDASGLTNFPTLNQNTTGTASNVTGIVSIANGGTGTNSAIGARQNLGLSWSGLTNTNAETFRTALELGSISTLSIVAISNVSGLQSALDAKLASNGNAVNLTNFPLSLLRTNGSASGLTNFPSLVLLTNGSASGLTNFPAFVLLTNGSASGLTNFPTLNQNTTGTASNVTGIVAITNGGSGATTAGGARTNLGLGATWLTNVDTTNFRSAILPSYSGNASKILAVNSGGTDIEWVTNAGGGSSLAVPVAVLNGGTGATNAATARINLGLGATWLTNTVESSFRSAIGLGTANAVTLGSLDVTGAINVTNKELTRANLGFSTNLNTIWIATNLSNLRSAILPSYSNNSSKVLRINSGGTDIEWAEIVGGTNTNLLTLPLAITNGGTGATNASQARANLDIPWNAGVSRNESGSYPFLGGGSNNSVSSLSFVGGGSGNTASATNTAIVGGQFNQANGNNSFVGGGAANQAESLYDVIGGGQSNNTYGGSFIGGGIYNTARGFASVVAGGRENIIQQTNADFGHIVGGFSNVVSAAFGAAGGWRAQANHVGAWVWADASTSEYTDGTNSATTNTFVSTNLNSFNIRSVGGMSVDLGTNGIIFRNSNSVAPSRRNLGFNTNVDAIWTATSVDNVKTVLGIDLLPPSEAAEFILRTNSTSRTSTNTDADEVLTYSFPSTGKYFVTLGHLMTVQTNSGLKARIISSNATVYGTWSFSASQLTNDYNYALGSISGQRMFHQWFIVDASTNSSIALGWGQVSGTNTTSIDSGSFLKIEKFTPQ